MTRKGWFHHLRVARDWWEGKAGCENPFDYETSTAEEMRHAAGPQVHPSQWSTMNRLLRVAGVLSILDERDWEGATGILICCPPAFLSTLSTRCANTPLGLLSSCPTTLARTDSGASFVGRTLSSSFFQVLADHYKSQKPALWPCAFAAVVEWDGPRHGLTRVLQALDAALAEFR